MKTKNIIIIIISCLALLVLAFTVVNHYSNLNEIEKHSRDLERFTDQIANNLKREGYNAIILSGEDIKNKKVILTFEIPFDKYTGKEIDDNIRDIVDRSAKENQLDLFSIEIEIETQS